MKVTRRTERGKGILAGRGNIGERRILKSLRFCVKFQKPGGAAEHPKKGQLNGVWRSRGEEGEKALHSCKNWGHVGQKSKK